MLTRTEGGKWGKWKGAGAKPPARLSLSARRPPHPGEFLESRFLRPLAITQTELAAALGMHGFVRALAQSSVSPEEGC